MIQRVKFGILLSGMFLALAACGSEDILVVTTTPQTEQSTPGMTTTAIPSPSAFSTATPKVAATPSPFPTLVVTIGPTPTMLTSEVDIQPIPLLPVGQEVSIKGIQMIDAANGWAIMASVAPLELEKKEDISRSALQDHILKTTDGGRTWQEVTPPELVSKVTFGEKSIYENTKYEEYKSATVFFLDTETAWVAYSTRDIYNFSFYEPNRVWYTTNGGWTWEKADLLWPVGAQTEAYGLCGSALSFLDQRYGWYRIQFCKNIKVIYRTTDGGASWMFIGDDLSDQISESGNYFELELIPDHVSFIDRLNGWGIMNSCANCDNSFTHLWSKDGGLSWEAQEMLWPDSYLESEEEGFHWCKAKSVSLFAPQDGWIIVECHDVRDDYGRTSYYLYASNDDGASWEVFPLPGGKVNFVSLSNGWALENSEPPQLQQTLDGGRTWQPVASVDWNGPFQFVNLRIGWALDKTTNPATLLKTEDGGRTWEPLSPSLVSANTSQPRSVPPRPALPELAALSPLTADNLDRVQLLDELPAEDATNLATSYRELAVTYADGQLGLWETGTGDYDKDYPVLLPWHTDWGYQIAFNTGEFSEKLPYLVTASKDGTAKSYYLPVLPAAGPAAGPTVDGHAGEITSAALYNSLLATGSEDTTVKIWDLGEYRRDLGSDEEMPALLTLEGHTDWVWDVAFSPDGRLLASASEDRSVRLWDVNSGEELLILAGHTSTVWRVAFSPDGNLLASASWDGKVKLWDVLTGQEVRTLSGHSDWLSALAFSPDGKLIASGSKDGTVRLWEVETGRELRKLSIDGTAVRGVDFTADGKLLAAVSSGGKLVFWGVLS